MTNVASDPDPSHAQTPAEYVALLRLFRDRSGLTYRTIQRRAAENGDSLPASTLATMLTRDTLPRAELVSAFLRACGEPTVRVDAWLEIRRDLLTAPVPSPDAGPADENADAPPAEAVPEPATRPAWYPARHPRLYLLSAGFTLAVVLITIVVVSNTGGTTSASGASSPSPSPSASPSPAQGLPPSGTYRFRIALSGLCLTEKPTLETGELWQGPCDQAMPTRSLVRLGDEYQITTDHPDFGPGCMGVKESSAFIGATVADDFCAKTGAGERFELVPALEKPGGFRIKALHSGLCVGLTGNSLKPWAAIRQVYCYQNRFGQIFFLDPEKTG
ncbi:helix-turn-helix domain-containing protein [Rhizohabitans arisaemae]|uniref:helix-turn-helix domain-containing protein n=1 Tax=Rhizohabitans arisaemae TaxID=2720610 RepID=UPI0024B16771|nr:helix-turn-helix transcriptional regulator [Rhizohabitans arisaemae]